MRRFAGTAVVLGMLGLATAFVLWLLPAEEFIFTPGNPRPLDDKVEVEGARPTAAGAVFYVDVLVRRTSRLEDLLPFLRPEGSTVVPEEALLPPGTSEADRERETTAQMERFALQIARMLGRNVTHGCQVAATGELALDGSVLSVGGLKQKTIGARREGVDVFLVPVGPNAADAQANADDMEIVPVESFQQALRLLTTSPRMC
jgi:PDZ domain-containing secreted protein